MPVMSILEKNIDNWYRYILFSSFTLYLLFYVLKNTDIQNIIFFLLNFVKFTFSIKPPFFTLLRL